MSALTFSEVVRYCAANKEFVANTDRLLGTNLSLRGAPLEQEIDISTGRIDHDCRVFIEMVHDIVWLRLPLVRSADASALVSGLTHQSEETSPRPAKEAE